jgi:ABC-2 type transport system ATP-binding protein
LHVVLSALDNYKTRKENGKFIQLSYPAGKANLEEINRYCFDKGVVLNHLQLKKKSLESKFFELTNGK